jgi:hypothetical protein
VCGGIEFDGVRNTAFCSTVEPISALAARAKQLRAGKCIDRMKRFTHSQHYSFADCSVFLYPLERQPMPSLTQRRKSIESIPATAPGLLLLDSKQRPIFLQRGGGANSELPRERQPRTPEQWIGCCGGARNVCY